MTKSPGRQQDARMDVEMVAEAVANRDGRFAQTLDKYQGPLLRYVGRMIGLQHGGVEDIVQECFLRLHRAWCGADGPPDDRVRAWLFTVAHNLTMDVIRKRTRRRAVQNRLEARLPAEPTDEFDALERITRSEAAAAALDALDRLPPKHKQVVLMKVIEGLTFRQIAKATGMSLGSVNHRLNRALETLAGQLKRCGHI